MDGDGDVDLVASRWGNWGLDVLLNDGTGLFSLAPNLSVDSDTRFEEFWVFDLGNDGDLDVCMDGRDTLTLINDGTGKLTPDEDAPLGHAYASCLMDIDGDGDLDLVGNGYYASVASQTFVLENRADGSLERAFLRLAPDVRATADALARPTWTATAIRIW